LTREVKKKACGVDADALSEFRKLIDESKHSADHLFNALDEGRKSLKQLAHTLDEKEQRLKTLVNDTGNHIPEVNLEKLENKENVQQGKKYEEAVRMARTGLKKEEIAHTLCLSEGEISLVLELDRKKNENI
jgi:exonuclease VII small subunit